MAAPASPSRTSLDSSLLHETGPMDAKLVDVVRTRLRFLHAILAEGTLQVSEVSPPQPQPTTPAQQSTTNPTSQSPPQPSTQPPTTTQTQAAALVQPKPITDGTLSDPRNIVKLPYPASYVRINDRSSRLQLLASGDQFVDWLPFMGREGLTSVLRAIDKLVVLSAEVHQGVGVVRLTDMRHPQERASASASASGSAEMQAPSTPPALRIIRGQARHSQLLIYGTPGWGKTYLAAAIAVLLIAERFRRSSDTASSSTSSDTSASKLRVVFIPSCKQLVSKPLRTMQQALIAAYADDDRACEAIAGSASFKQLADICSSVDAGTLLFLLDDYNEVYAYERRSADTNDKSVTRFLDECSAQHFRVAVASINDSNKDDIVKKQMPVALQPFFGGLTKTEQTHWLLHMQPWLPVPGTDTTLTQTDINERILAEAGGNLLFLQPFLASPDNTTTWTWQMAFQQYQESQEVDTAVRHLSEFISASTRRGNLSDVLAMWLDCTRRSRVRDNRELYDARYFWVANGVGHTVCGLVDAFVLQEVEKQPDGDISLTNSEFMRIIRTSIGNRSAQGFLVERSVLGFLRRGDVLQPILERPGLLPSSEPPIRLHSRFFSVEAGGAISQDFLLKTRVALYIPHIFNYQAVDCIIRIIQPLPTGSKQPRRTSQRVKGAKERQAKAKKQKRDDEGRDKAEEKKRGRGRGRKRKQASKSSSDSDGEDSDDEEKDEEEGRGAVDTSCPRDVTVIAVQITLAKLTQEKKNRTNRFFESAEFWSRDVPQARVNYALLYVMQDPPSQPPTPVESGSGQVKPTPVLLAEINQILDAAARGK